jgi:hypothetical protein
MLLIIANSIAESTMRRSNAPPRGSNEAHDILAIPLTMEMCVCGTSLRFEGYRMDFKDVSTQQDEESGKKSKEIGSGRAFMRDVAAHLQLAGDLVSSWAAKLPK